MDHFPKQEIELFVEESAAVEYSSRFGKEESRILQMELSGHFLDLFNQAYRPRCQNRLRRRVTGFCGFRNDGKHFGKDDRGLFASAIDELGPSAIKGAADFIGQQKLFFVQDFLEAARHGFPADVVGASGIANDGPKTASARHAARRSSSQNGRASSGNHDQAGDFSSSSK